MEIRLSEEHPLSDAVIWALLNEKLNDHISFEDFCGRIRSKAGEWQHISTHPRDDKPFLGMSADDDWPMAMKWQPYDEDEAAETGEPGFWIYCELLVADVTGAAEPVWWRPMIDLPPGVDA